MKRSQLSSQVSAAYLLSCRALKPLPCAILATACAPFSSGIRASTRSTNPAVGRLRPSEHGLLQMSEPKQQHCCSWDMSCQGGIKVVHAQVEG